MTEVDWMRVSFEEGDTSTEELHDDVETSESLEIFRAFFVRTRFAAAAPFTK